MSRREICASVIENEKLAFILYRICKIISELLGKMRTRNCEDGESRDLEKMITYGHVTNLPSLATGLAHIVEV